MLQKNLIYDPSDPLLQIRQRFLSIMSVVLIVSSLAWIGGNAFVGSLTLDPAELISGSLIIVMAVLAFFLGRRGRIHLAAVLAITPLVVLLLYFDYTYVELIGAILAVIAAGVLLNNVLFGVVLIISALNFVVNIVQVVNEFGFTYQEDGERAVVHLMVIMTVGSAVRYFVSTAERTAQVSSRTASLLRATSEVGQNTAKLLTLNELFNRAVQLIQDRFAFYHVQVFLVDENREWAKLVASTGEAGEKLLAKKHQLRVGSQSVIGRVTQVGEPVISRDTDTDKIHAMNELLPNTRSELALPIIDNDVIIGALDVQSTRRDAFNATDIQALEVMASQLAVAIRNARLFEEQERALQENKRLFLQAEAERREVQRLNNQLTREAWENYLKEQRALNGVTVLEEDVVEHNDWSTVMLDASLKQRPITREIEGERVTAVPIVLRNQVIGVIEVRDAKGSEAERNDVITSVAQRLATTLDNIRLFDEAQYATAQEQRINQIVTHYQTADSIEDLLKITLDELTHTLDAERAMIRLGISASDQPLSSQNGSSSHV